MMYVVNPKNYNPIASLLRDALQEKGRTPLGQTQKDRARSEGERAGLVEGRLDGVAAIINYERAKRYSELDQIDLVTDHDVRAQVLKPLEAEVTELLADLPVDSKLDVRQEAERPAWIKALDRVQKLIQPEHLENARVELRKKRVLAGEVEPTDDDREWLEEMYVSAKAVTDEYAKLLNK